MSHPSDRSGSATSALGPGGTPARQDARKSERPSMRPGGPESLVGTVLGGRYFIERLIGEGGMGAVYQAEHTHMHKRLAVKVLHPEMSRLPEVVARFEREAMAAAHIEHPNVASATDFGKLDDGSFFLVLEYVEGKSLREAIAEGRMDLGRALHIMRQITSALGRAHALGIVHRDLKPENVMLVTRDGDSDFAKVLDFGIAKVPVGELVGEHKAPGQALTQLGMVYGTPEYMAPEQALGQAVDPRADLYALGVITFEMITGNRPFEHESKVTLLGMHVTAPIPSMLDRVPEANVPAEVDAIVRRLLAKEATARFADARELLDALDTVSMQLAARGRIADPLPPMSMTSPSRASFSNEAGHSHVSAVSGPRSALAVGPTSLAQPTTGSGAQHAHGLASLVGASVGQVVKNAPAWMTPRRMAFAAVGLGAVLLMLAIAIIAVASGGSAKPASSAVVSAEVPVPTAPPKPPDPAADQVVLEAQGKIDKGDYATAIDELTALEKKDPDRADVHMLLERAYTGVRNGPAAMGEADQWLEADPSAAADLKLQEDVRNAALFHDTQDVAFALLEAHMGMRGIDILYDIAYGASGRLYPQAATHAKQSLNKSDVKSRASPALSILLQFRDARTCEQKHALLQDAGDKGDGRMASMLQPYQSTRGCGFLGRSDCFPCLHKDTALRDAMTEIAERVSRAQQQ
ncbi:MAG TPA: serine/threonine-protein kinase [Polyangiaceae bacterium]|nr:serine/threonine-protein kinase [Polyangiaceae bacterium]